MFEYFKSPVKNEHSIGYNATALEPLKGRLTLPFLKGRLTLSLILTVCIAGLAARLSRNNKLTQDCPLYFTY